MGSDEVRASARCRGDAVAAAAVAGIAAAAEPSACSLMCVDRMVAARWNDGDWACMVAARRGAQKPRKENDVGEECAAAIGGGAHGRGEQWSTCVRACRSSGCAGGCAERAGRVNCARGPFVCAAPLIFVGLPRGMTAIARRLNRALWSVATKQRIAAAAHA